jgi:hypothetical protein
MPQPVKCRVSQSVSSDECHDLPRVTRPHPATGKSEEPSSSPSSLAGRVGNMVGNMVGFAAEEEEQRVVKLEPKPETLSALKPDGTPAEVWDVDSRFVVPQGNR